MQPMQRLTIIALAFVISLGAAIGIFLYISLLPHIGLIGWIVAALVILGLGCTGALMFTFTLHKIARWRIHRNVIAVGEYLVYRDPHTGEFTHLSAEHVRAGVPPLPQVTVKELPSPDPRWDAVLDLRHEGKGMHQIAKELKVPYQRVRTFLNQVEQNDEGN